MAHTPSFQILPVLAALATATAIWRWWRELVRLLVVLLVALVIYGAVALWIDVSSATRTQRSDSGSVQLVASPATALHPDLRPCSVICEGVTR
jgi:hypothetical protein